MSESTLITSGYALKGKGHILIPLLPSLGCRCNGRSWSSHVRPEVSITYSLRQSNQEKLGPHHCGAISTFITGKEMKMYLRQGYLDFEYRS